MIRSRFQTARPGRPGRPARADKTNGVALAALVVLAAITSMPAPVRAEGIDLTDVDRALPGFELDGLDGATWNPDALAGKPWIVNFWATWCAPCIEEMPAMNEAHASLGDAVGMLAINAGEGAEAIDAFLEKIPVDFPIALGDGATTLPNWAVRALPTTLVVSPDGQVVYEALGPRDWADEALLDRVRALIEP